MDVGLESGQRCRRIAIVEDDESLAMLLRYNLEAGGFLVDTIGTGVNALPRLAAGAPDLIVLDWGLPGIAGIELLRRLRGNAATRHVPVIMLTGRDDACDRRRALGAGAAAFVSKPFSMGALMAQIGALLSVAEAH